MELDKKSIKLYKYYAFCDYNLDALENGYWYFSTPEYRNDPFDCCSETYQAVLGRNLSREEEQCLNDFGACCFSKSLENLHLWALYANSHTGFVLEFEFTEDDYFILTSKGVCLPVFDITYLNEIPNFNEIIWEELQSKRYFSVPLNKLSPARLCKEIQDLRWYLAHSLKQKKVWEIEDEVRMLLGTQKPSKNIPGLFQKEYDNQKAKGYKIYYPRHCVCKCIAGLSISDENLINLNKICLQLNIPLSKMVKGVPFEIKEQF